MMDCERSIDEARLEELSFTIPLPPVTKKNSQRIINVHGRPCIIPSKQYKKYAKACQPFLVSAGIDYPVNVQAVFYMPTRRRVDLTNLMEALHDIMVDGGVITDDNCRVVVSCDGSRVKYDKANPRTEVTITRSSEEFEGEEKT